MSPVRKSPHLAPAPANKRFRAVAGRHTERRNSAGRKRHIVVPYEMTQPSIIGNRKESIGALALQNNMLKISGSGNGAKIRPAQLKRIAGFILSVHCL
jgi:hypothetical protein